MAEARARHEAERDAVERDNAQQRRELAEEERRVAAEKVRSRRCGPLQTCSRTQKSDHCSHQEGMPPAATAFTISHTGYNSIQHILKHRADSFSDNGIL